MKVCATAHGFRSYIFPNDNLYLFQSWHAHYKHHSSNIIIYAKKSIVIVVLVVCITMQAGRSLIIGIAEVRGAGSASVGRSYVQAVLMGGHVPVIIPDIDDPVRLRKVLKKIDILLLPGGVDVAPERYGEARSPQLGSVNIERDAFEYRILTEAVRLRKPILGICRGIQVLNVFLGGSLYQDLPSEYPDTTVNHWDAPHRITVKRNTRLFRLLERESVEVNSFHHQAVKRLAPGLRVCACAPDGTIEAVECDSLPLAGVQFHPELLTIQGDSLFLNLFRDLKRLWK